MLHANLSSNSFRLKLKVPCTIFFATSSAMEQCFYEWAFVLSCLLFLQSVFHGGKAQKNVAMCPQTTIKQSANKQHGREKCRIFNRPI